MRLVSNHLLLLLITSPKDVNSLEPIEWAERNYSLRLNVH